MDHVNCLRQMNYNLMGLEHDTAPKPDLKHPVLFVVGAPRSGTTLATQFLAYGLNTGYITNIAARFWNAPTLGVRVSHDILGDDPAGDMGPAFFSSNQGQTPYGGGIHEFGYFWRSICWESPKLHQIAQIQAIVDKPLVMKGIYPARYASLVRETLGDKVKFVSIDRPFYDVLASVMKIATDSEKSDFWFRGWELPVHKDARISSLPLNYRVAVRIYYWVKLSASVADYTLHLPNICADPTLALKALTQVIDGIDAYREMPCESCLGYHSYDDQEAWVDMTDPEIVSYCEAICKELP